MFVPIDRGGIEMAIEPKGPAPYAPAQTVIDLLEGYRNRGFATPFTPEVLQKASIPDSLVNRTLQTFRLFDLIDDKGNPTDQLVEYKSCLQSWLTSIYTDVLKYADPATDEQKKVSEAFRGYTPEGQRGRMVTLMIGLFAYAGLIEEPPKRPASPKANRTTKNAAGRAATKQRNSRRTPDASEKGGNSIQSGLAPTVVGFLEVLPGVGKKWTTEARDAWWKAFEVTFNYAYPTDDSASDDDDDLANDEGDS
jgi:hypothetical protein